MTPLDTISSCNATAPELAPAVVNDRGPKGYSSVDTLASAEKPARTSLPAKLGIVAGATLVLSAVLYGMGAALQVGARSVSAAASQAVGRVRALLEVASAFLGRAGSAAEAVGRTLFLVVTVPPYMILYQLPRWLITEQLPHVIRLASEWLRTMSQIMIRLCRAMTEQAVQLASWSVKQLVHAAEWIRNLLRPIVAVLERVWTASLQVMQRTARIAWELSRQVAAEFYDLSMRLVSLCREMVDVARIALTRLGRKLEPVIRLFVNHARRVIDTTMRLWGEIVRRVAPIVRAVVDALVNTAHLVSQVATESWRMIGDMGVRFGKAVTHAAKIVGSKVAHVALVTANFVVRAGQLLADTTLQVGRVVVHTLHQVVSTFVSWMAPGLRFALQRLEIVTQTFVSVAKQIVTVATRVATVTWSMLETVSGAMASAARWVYEYVGPPLLAALRVAATFLVDTAQFVWTYVTKVAAHLWQTMLSVTAATAAAGRQLASWVFAALRSSRDALVRGASVATSRVRGLVDSVVSSAARWGEYLVAWCRRILHG